jgi:hypothetical protein
MVGRGLTAQVVADGLGLSCTCSCDLDGILGAFVDDAEVIHVAEHFAAFDEDLSAALVGAGLTQ